MMAHTYCKRCGSGPLENDSVGDGWTCGDCGCPVSAGRIVLADDGPPRYEGKMTCCGCGRNNCAIGVAFCEDCTKPEAPRCPAHPTC